MLEETLYKFIAMNSGFKEGDKVHVLYKCPDNYMGWQSVWVATGQMNDLVGKTGIIIYIGFYGCCVELDGGDPKKDWFLPCFVLEKVEDA